jgi:HD-like signal output (HDOD) protein
MVLAEDLVSPQGRLLFCRGVTLEEKHIRACKVWGIAEVAIEGVTPPPEEVTPKVIPPELLHQASELCLEFFALNNVRHPVVREAMKIYRDRAALCLLDDRQRALAVIARKSPPPVSTEPAPVPSLDDLAKLNMKMASTPDVFNRILQALNDPYSSASYMADVLGKDIALSTRILRAVNSAYYGCPKKVDTLTRAITIIGISNILNLAVGIVVISMFTDFQDDEMNMANFWRHSIGCGIIARMLAIRSGKQNEERYFVAGLIHDIGRLVMLQNFSPAARKAILQSRSALEPLQHTERKLWGFTHADVADRLFDKWDFPEFFKVCIANHHAPGAVAYDDDACLLHAADFWCHALNLGISGASLAPPLDAEAWERLKVSKGTMGSLLVQIDSQVDDAMRAFLGN